MCLVADLSEGLVALPPGFIDGIRVRTCGGLASLQPLRRVDRSKRSLVLLRRGHVISCTPGARLLKCEIIGGGLRAPS
jgi:hypothetical protein